MRRSNWTPSIVPSTDQTVYLVADDFGKIGRAWREADLEATDLETVIQHLMGGEYSDPIRVIGFNAAERWSEDVSEDIAREIQRGAGSPTGLCRSTSRRSPATDPTARLRPQQSRRAGC